LFIPRRAESVAEKEILCSEEMDNMLTRLSFQIVEACDLEKVVIVGIKRGGAVLAERLKSLIETYKKSPVELGSLDITLYRDDLSQIAEYPVIHGTEIDFSVKGKTIVLVDDVVYTGRTVRAALDALIDLGRPDRIVLVAMVDRGHRELPIQPDFIGKNVPTSSSEIIHVKLKEMHGEDSITIEKK